MVDEINDVYEQYRRAAEQWSRDHVTTLLKEQLHSNRIWQAADMADWQRRFDILSGSRDPNEPVVFKRVDNG
jgi:hypothetical protein